MVTYEYDSASRLIQRVEGGTTTNYHWDGWDLIREVKTGTITETTNYLVPFGEVLAFERGGDWFYLHGDALSSTQLVTDENGDQVGRFIYGAWGEELYASEIRPGTLREQVCRRPRLPQRRGHRADLHAASDGTTPPPEIHLAGTRLGWRVATNLYTYAGSAPVRTFCDPLWYCDAPGGGPVLRSPPGEPSQWEAGITAVR